MTRPVISVCVATYNQRGLIETCLRSILDQQVDAEVLVLVGDDASTDGTSEVVERLAKSYGRRLLHLQRNPNMGAVDNMCDLVARADGEFVARVDGDDYWLPGKLAAQLAFLRRHPGCRAVFSNAITVGESNRRVGLFNDVGDARFGLPEMLRRGNFLNNSSILFRGCDRGGWVGAGELIDFQLHLQLAQTGWLGHIGEPLAAYRVGAPGSMVVASNERVRELYWQAIQSVPRALVTDDDYAHGITDFLRRVFFRAIRTRDPSLLGAWAARVYAASPYGAWRTTALAVANIARMAAKMALGRLRGGNHRNVLYRR